MVHKPTTATPGAFQLRDLTGAAATLFYSVGSVLGGDTKEAQTKE